MKNEQNNEPLISIITVSYNSEKYIEETINSVISQGFKDFEFIIIDGGSQDRTVDIIRKYASSIDYWISEPDRGQSDAFIKGFKRAKGKWLTWLNSDDLLLPDSLMNFANQVNTYHECKLFFGNSVWTDSENIILECRKGERASRFMPRIGYLIPYGPSAFFTRDLYNSTKGIDMDMHFLMDIDLWWKLYEKSGSFRRIPGYTWTLRLHPEAKMSGHHFDDSEFKDPNHQNWALKNSEFNNILDNNGLQASNKKYLILSILFKLSSWEYISGRIDSIAWKGKRITEVFRK